MPTKKELRELQFDPYFENEHPKFMDRTINAMLVVMAAAILVAIACKSATCLAIGVVLEAVVFLVARSIYNSIKNRYVND